MVELLCHQILGHLFFERGGGWGEVMRVRQCGEGEEVDVEGRYECGERK